MNCYSGSNNIHFDFPPIMADGRNFVTWQTPASIDESIRVEEHIQSNKDYRAYLQENALSIMRTNTTEATQMCAVQKTPGPPVPNKPYLYESYLEKTKPFGYENSDLKEQFLAMFQEKGSTISPHITQFQLIDWANKR